MHSAILKHKIDIRTSIRYNFRQDTQQTVPIEIQKQQNSEILYLQNLYHVIIRRMNIATDYSKEKPKTFNKFHKRETVRI
jgi:hypothetical protein